MPRPIIRQKENTRQGAQLSTRTSQAQQPQSRTMPPAEQDRLLRKTRSKEYIEAVHRLDSGGAVMNSEQVAAIVDTLVAEFPELNLPGVLRGIVAVCYLGKPYEVHSLDMSGAIITHYKSGETMPNGLEKARSLARRGGYAFVEVYDNCLRAVSDNGAVSVVPA